MNLFHFIAQTTQPVTWLTPEFITVLVALVTAIGAAVAAVIAALRGTAADTKADAAQNTANQAAGHAQSLDRQMTTMALNTAPPGTTRPPSPLWLLPLLLIPFLVGCSPNAAFVAAERKTHDAIADEYVGYSQADPNKDEQEKAIDRRLIEQWGRDLDQMEREVKGGQ